MAGIEKVCEYSGDYPSPGWSMYGYKRNHIQVMPKYRKLFRGATGVLEITEVEYIAEFKFGGYFTVDQRYVDGENEDLKEFGLTHLLKQGDLTLKKLIKQWDDYFFNRNTKLKKLYTFCLNVADLHLQGEVEGKYYNHTTDLPATIKRLKRLLRCRNLKVINNVGKE